MIDFDKIIGQNLKALRESLGFTQENVASYLKIDRVMISYFENATRPIPIPDLLKLADLYGVDMKELMEDNPVQSKLNAAFAFRATNVSTEDLETIAKFKRIAKNYIKVKEEWKNLRSND